MIRQVLQTLFRQTMWLGLGLLWVLLLMFGLGLAFGLVFDLMSVPSVWLGLSNYIYTNLTIFLNFLQVQIDDVMRMVGLEIASVFIDDLLREVSKSLNSLLDFVGRA